MKESLLTDICEVQYGYAFDSKLFNDNEGLPVIRIRDVVRGYSETKTTEKCPDSYIINNGDILIGMDGEFNIARWKGGKALLNQRVCKLIPKYVNADYVLYYMPIALKAIEEKTPFVTVKHLSAKEINKIVVPLPDKFQQRYISKLLSLCDSLLLKNMLLLKKLDELIKSRFVEMFGDPVLNIQKWIKVPMGNYMSLLTDFSANGSYEYLDSNVVMYSEPNYALMVRTTDLERNDFNNDVKYIDEKAYNILSKSKLFGNEIIMNKIGSAGKVYLMPKLNRPASLGRNAFMFRFNSDINILFLYYLLTSEYGLSEIQQHVRGAVTKTITKDAARSIRIIVPPIELQNQFADFVTQVEKQKATVQQSIDKLETLKKSLMQEYFG